jgi:hypothetical protein
VTNASIKTRLVERFSSSVLGCGLLLTGTSCSGPHKEASERTTVAQGPGFDYHVLLREASLKYEDTYLDKDRLSYDL